MANAVERTRAQYDALAGALYDFGVERPAVARLGALAMWSADSCVFYAPMDELREPTAGMTILDVPCGGDRDRPFRSPGPLRRAPLAERRKRM